MIVVYCLLSAVVGAGLLYAFQYVVERRHAAESVDRLAERAARWCHQFRAEEGRWPTVDELETAVREADPTGQQSIEQIPTIVRWIERENLPSYEVIDPDPEFRLLVPRPRLYDQDAEDEITEGRLRLVERENTPADMVPFDAAELAEALVESWNEVGRPISLADHMNLTQSEYVHWVETTPGELPEDFLDRFPCLGREDGCTWLACPQEAFGGTHRRTECPLEARSG